MTIAPGYTDDEVREFVHAYERQRPTIPKKKGKRAPREVPVVTATRPGQAWSWDITDLLTPPWRGVAFKAYKITDIYSREIVGHRVEDREADPLALEMFEDAITERGAAEVVHADSGAAMRSNEVREALTGHGAGLSHNRPYSVQRQPILRGRIPHDEVPARLPARIREPRFNTRLHC